MSKGYTKIIKQKLAKSSVGEAITTKSFSRIPKASAITILNRIAKSDSTIKRIKHGVFGKVKQTKYGIAKLLTLELLETEINNDNNKCFGGTFLFNKLGLTTQVPAIIEVLNNKSSYKVKIGNTIIHYSKIRPTIQRKNKNDIVILEVIKKIKVIPDQNIQMSIDWIQKSLNKLNRKQINQLVETSMGFNPQTRAILGTFLLINHPKQAIKIRASLNENSYYIAGVIYDYLYKPEEWRLRK